MALNSYDDIDEKYKYGLSDKKPKNRSISILLCALFGIWGAHRFYEGKIITGILWACTAGLGLIGWIIDLIILINKPKYYEP